MGHIIIATGRRMRTHKGNVAAVVADIGEVTIRTLRTLRIPYHELSFGKPYAQFYIDDLAVSAFRDLHRETGFYPGSSRCTPAAAAAPSAPKPTLTASPPHRTSSTSWPLLILVSVAAAAA